MYFTSRLFVTHHPDIIWYFIESAQLVALFKLVLLFPYPSKAEQDQADLTTEY